MSENINLIPAEVIQERNLHNTFNRFLYFSILVLVISFVALGVAAFLSTNSQSKLTKITNEVSTKQDELKSLQDVERQGSELVARLGFVDTLLNNKVYNSLVMQEMNKRNIAGIVINSISLTDSFDLTINGVATSTTILQRYVSNLVAEPDNLFSNALIKQVSIKEDSGAATFGITVTADSTKLIGEPTDGNTVE